MAHQVGERCGEGAEEDRVATLQGAQAEVLGERRLSDAGRAAEQDVFAAAEEIEPEKMLVELIS